MKTFKVGDYVYGYHREIGTIPARVVKVSKKTLLINDGEKNYRLSKANIEHQTN